MRDPETVQAEGASVKAPMPVMAPSIGIILAGGQSSRMGQDKALLTFRGKTLLSIAERTLMQAGCGRVLMSGALRPDWHGQHIPDLFAHQGPVGGVVSCIEALAQEGRIDQHTEQDTEISRYALLVFVAVDTPLLSARTLAPLLAEQVNPAVDLSSAITGARYAHHPIPFVLRLSPSVYAHAKMVKQQLTAGQSCSVNAFTEPLGLTQVLPDHAQTVQLRNINTPEDWSELNHEFADQSR